MKLFCDLETYSECPISRGSHRYAEDPTTDILLWGYAIDDEPAKVWDRTQQRAMPPDLAQALQRVDHGAGTWIWHNGMSFDTVVLERFGFTIPLDAVEDTMVIAYQHGLPGALKDLCAIYKLSDAVAKDADGARLVNLFCKPQPVGRKVERATRLTHPEDWARFVNYCRLDVEAERAIYHKLPRFNCTKAEHDLQMLDARINRRGMQMDVELARAAIAAYDEESNRLRQRTAELTDGAVESATRTQALIETIRRQFGVELANLQKSEIARMAENDSLPEPLRELLRVRLSSAKASVKKFQSVLDSVNQDGRLRGTLQFRGAARTGRWAGRLFQPQNISRPTMSQEQIDLAIQCTKWGVLDSFFPDPNEALSNCLRGLIIVPEGSKMIVADYSNIEGRVLAWLAGETWKLDAFRAFDAGQGPDMYKMTYSKAFATDVTAVTKSQRQMGKVLELAMGYGGGPGAFVTFARGYGINLEEMAAAVLPSVPAAVLNEAVRAYEWAMKEPDRLCGLSRDVWLACDCVKRLWRQANPRIVAFWKATEDACVQALANEGMVFRFGPCAAARWGSWLLLRLPSGRYLCYPAPKEGDGSCAFSYMGTDQSSRKWRRIKTYAGKLVENITQAVAADILSAALLTLERNNYKPVLTVHDEVLTEAPDNGMFTHEDMEKLMCRLPEWADGLPLAAAGFEATRYHK